MKIQKLKEEFVLKYTANLMEKTLFPHYEIQVCIHTSEKTQVWILWKRFSKTSIWKKE